MSEEVGRDAKPMKRYEEKSKERPKHWQCDMDVQDLEDMRWRKEDLRSLEEGLPRLKEGNLERAARSYKATSGVDCDGFTLKFREDVSKETISEIVKFFEKVEQCGRWPQQACTTMFFVPKMLRAHAPSRLCPS